MLKRGNIILKTTWEDRIMVIQARKMLKRAGLYHRLDCIFLITLSIFKLNFN